MKLKTLLLPLVLLVGAFAATMAHSQGEPRAGVTILFDKIGLKYGIDADVFEIQKFSKELVLKINGTATKAAADGSGVWTGGGIALRYTFKSGLTFSLLAGATANLVDHSIKEAPSAFYGGFTVSWPLGGVP